jgi:3-oxoacyl-[acyl-carrier-protein] synthase III
MTSRILLRGLAYHFDEVRPIDEIALLAQSPDYLSSLKQKGLRNFAYSEMSLGQQAIASARKTLDAAGLAAADIDAVVVGTSEMPYFDRFPEMLGTEILMGLGLRDLPVVGVTLAGCANYASSLRVARNMLIAEGLRNVLLIETNQVRGTMQRVPVSRFTGDVNTVFADGAASMIVSACGAADHPGLTLDGMAQTVSPIDAHRVQMGDVWVNAVTAFRSVIDAALEQAGAFRADVRKVFYLNVNAVQSAALAPAFGFEVESLHAANLARTAHVWSSDNLISLSDYCATEQVAAGALFLLLCQGESYFSAIACRRH